MTAIVRKTWIDDDGSGQTGTLIKNSTLQGDIYDPVDTALAASLAGIGKWIDIPFVATDFSGSNAMVWTVAAGNVATWQYMTINGLAIVQFDVAGSPLTGTASTYLTLKLPVTVLKVVQQVVYVVNVTTGTLGVSALGGNNAWIYRDATLGTNWTLGATAGRISGTLMFRI